MNLPAPTSVKVLLLDVGGVLVRPNFDRLAAALRAHGVFADPAAMAAAEPRIKKTLDRPPSPGSRGIGNAPAIPDVLAGHSRYPATDAERGWHYFNLVLSQSGVARSAATDAALAEVKAWHDQHCLWEDVLPGVRPALERVRGAGLRLAAVSNSNGTLRRLFDRLGFSPLFEVILDSQVEGIEKPDPRLFQLALEKLGAPAGDAMHAGDFYNVDVAGARAAGIRPVLVDEAGLYPDADCPRVASLAELAAHLVPEARGAISAKLPAER
jgi:HAD superfamily hydrolase (TIGR01549 family)